MKPGIHKVAWLLKWETKINILCNAFYFFKVNFTKIGWVSFTEIITSICWCKKKPKRLVSCTFIEGPTLQSFSCWAKFRMKPDFLQNSWLLSALHHELIVVLSLFSKVKRSIFASPESVNGKVGVGTCGIADKPMTQYNDTSKYNVRHLMPQWFRVLCK